MAGPHGPGLGRPGSFEDEAFDPGTHGGGGGEPLSGLTVPDPDPGSDFGVASEPSDVSSEVDAETEDEPCCDASPDTHGSGEGEPG